MSRRRRTVSEQDDPILEWANAHPEEAEVMAGEFVAVSLARELLDHDKNFEPLYERVCALERLDLCVGRLFGPGSLDAAPPARDPQALLATVFESRPWAIVARGGALDEADVAELRRLIETLVRGGG